MSTPKIWKPRGASLASYGIDGVVTPDTPFEIGEVRNAGGDMTRVPERPVISITDLYPHINFNSYGNAGLGAIYLLNHLNQPMTIATIVEKLCSEYNYVNCSAMKVELHWLCVRLKGVAGVNLDKFKKRPVEYVMYLDEKID